jgi:hypothetical protein
MRYYCKLIFAEKIEPTVEIADAAGEEVEGVLRTLLQQFLADSSIEGLYLGKSGPADASYSAAPRNSDSR